MAEKSLEERIQRLEAVNEIQNLMSRYEYLHTAGLHEKTAEMFAKKAPGVKATFPAWGVYEGTESIRRAFVGVHSFQDGDRIGKMRMHTLTTPVIEVAGDGKTAKGVWISPGHETMPDKSGELKAYWAWAKYGCDFVKEDGKWKFWHIQIYGIFFNPYDQSWVESGPPALVDIPNELMGDRPNTYFWMYSPDVATENVPAPPEPYETFDETFSY